MADVPARHDEERRQAWAVDLADRMDRPMSLLGMLFLFVVLGQVVARQPQLVTSLSVLGWGLWLTFVGEYVLRLYVAPRRKAFLMRTWWQVLFLAVPFLRFLRVLRVARLGVFGRLASSAVRGSRSAGRLLSNRLAWLGALSAVVALAASQILYLVGAYASYGEALHDAALATITGEPLSADSGWARLLEVVLAAYSVAVFATMAASVGAYFLVGARGERTEPPDLSPPPRPAGVAGASARPRPSRR